MAIKVLFVCLGNICRSPAAEGVFIDLIRSKGLQDEFEVDSAGTGAWHAGSPADSRMRKAAMERGLFLNTKARQITLEDISYFDYILTMDEDNYANVKRLSTKSKDDFIAKIIPMLTYSKNTIRTDRVYYNKKHVLFM